MLYHPSGPLERRDLSRELSFFGSRAPLRDSAIQHSTQTRMAARAAAEADVATSVSILPTTIRLQTVRCRRESCCLVEVRGADHPDEWGC